MNYFLFLFIQQSEDLTYIDLFIAISHLSQNKRFLHMWVNCDFINACRVVRFKFAKSQ